MNENNYYIGQPVHVEVDHNEGEKPYVTGTFVGFGSVTNPPNRGWKVPNVTYAVALVELDYEYQGDISFPYTESAPPSIPVEIIVVDLCNLSPAPWYEAQDYLEAFLQEVEDYFANRTYNFVDHHG